MNFDFTDEQTMLRESLIRLLAQSYSFEKRQQIVRSESGTSTEVWRQLGQLGLLALPFPEELGGLGGSVTDIVAISEVFGAHLMIEPYLSSIILAGRAFALANTHPEATGWLGRIIGGKVRAAFAHEEGSGTPAPSLILTTATAGQHGFSLQGQKRLVLDGADADILVVSVRLAGDGHADGELGLLLVDPGAAGVSITRYTTIDGRRAADLRFDKVAIAASSVLVANASECIDEVISGAIMALAAEAVGAMGALLEMTVGYASTRKQFGVAIGSFQVIAHRMADMKIAFIKARSTLIYTTALVEAGRVAPRDISLLKAQVGRLGRIVGESAIQIHGGVGMADELAVGHHLKRILAIDAMFGTGDHHLRTVGSTI